MENVRARQGSRCCDFIFKFCCDFWSHLLSFWAISAFFPDLRFYAALRFCVGLSMERAVSWNSLCRHISPPFSRVKQACFTGDLGSGCSVQHDSMIRPKKTCNSHFFWHIFSWWSQLTLMCACTLGSDVWLHGTAGIIKIFWEEVCNVCDSS